MNKLVDDKHFFAILRIIIIIGGIFILFQVVDCQFLGLKVYLFFESLIIVIGGAVTTTTTGTTHAL